MIIKHNLSAMNTRRQLNLTGNQNAKVTEKLSSGYKINRAADDAAGLAMSEKMRRQIRGLNQGIANTQDGVSLNQVADGALAEVHKMLHRITELSVKAANGTNSPQDRQAIQHEITEILAEIDRIGDTTKFNELHIFKGTDVPVLNGDGTPAIPGRIPVKDLQLVDLELGKYPFNSSSDADHLQLQAIVNNKDSKLNGQSYNLVYGNGSTSSSSMRIRYTPGTASTITEKTVPLKECHITNYQPNLTADPPQWSRDFTYSNGDGVELKITQTVTADMDGTDEKYYGISYSVENTGSVEVNLDFQFHVDTAYNNNDRCEGYFVGGKRVEKSCIYSEQNSGFTNSMTGNPNVISGVPDSLSIVDVDNALAFSEKVKFDVKNKPDSFSIGYYHAIHNWDYYSSGQSLGQDMIGADLGFSLLWNDNLRNNDKAEYTFQYGIAETAKDTNLENVPLQSDMTQLIDHYSAKPVWIQSGCDAGDGIWLELGEMNCKVLGIEGLDVTTMDGACDAIDQVGEALGYISAFRSRLGAQQNRLEHTIANESNVVENTSAAESLIRDTDMADRMVQHSLNNVLLQSGQAMLAQANKGMQGVLQMLQ